MTELNDTALSPRLHEITLRTDALATPPGFLPMLRHSSSGETRIRVLLPAGYDPKGTRRYPVLYLFHGGTENHAAWTTPDGKGKAEELTRGLPLIIVMPDGGVAGGHADWYNGGALGAPRWKSYHLDQLIPWIDAQYRTIANRSGRATAGLSMGGGALRYAAQRPDLIGATAAFSGDVDITQSASDWRGAGAMISKMIWGDFAAQEVRWRGMNGPDLAKNLVNSDVSIFSGDTGRPEATYILPGATKLHERLKQFGIAHQFTVYPGMSHSWPNWNKALAEWLPHLMARFERGGSSVANPRTFSFSSIEPSYGLYGWTVDMQRPVAEFSALEVVGAHRFTLIGSGDATVRPPSIGAANIPFSVTIRQSANASASSQMTMTTDARGRLALPVRLGPANPFQQYGKEANAAATGASSDSTPFELFNNGSRFYRADVSIKATAAGLCRAIDVFTADQATRKTLCHLLKRAESGGNAGPSSLRALTAATTNQIGRTLTQEQADALLQWSNAL